MKPIANKEYGGWQKYKSGYILLPDIIRFICEANYMDPEKIGRHFLEVVPKACLKE